MKVLSLKTNTMKCDTMKSCSKRIGGLAIGSIAFVASSIDTTADTYDPVGEYTSFGQAFARDRGSVCVSLGQ